MRTQSKSLVAQSEGAVGAFNVILIEHAEALVTASENAGRGVILQISQNCVEYHGRLKPIAQATIAIAEASKQPISIHLDHSESEDLVREALDLGFDSVMFDGSKLEFTENVKSSKRIANICHSYGATIEVELGEVGGKDGVHAPGVRTNPQDARRFVEETSVDLLAVAVGTSHAMTNFCAPVNVTKSSGKVGAPKNTSSLK